MNLSELMKTTPETLALQQYIALKRHVLERLELVKDEIMNESFNIEPLTFFSPAGDGMGEDNSCVDFSYNQTDNPVDIAEIVQQLKKLKGQTRGK